MSVRGGLFLYHLSHAVRSLRRDPGLSVAITVGLTVATSMWTITSVHYIRVFGPRPWASPAIAARGESALQMIGEHFLPNEVALHRETARERSARATVGGYCACIEALGVFLLP